MMERIEKEPLPSTLMKKNEPTFVPEWLKTATGGSVSNGGSNHIFGPSLHSAAILSRNRLSVNTCNHSHSTAFTERSSSSYRRGSSTNGSHNQVKDKSVHARSSGSFVRSHHERDWDKDIDFHDKKKLINFESGFDSISNRSAKDPLMQSQHMISGKHCESWSKRTGSDPSVLSVGSTVSSTNKASFEREFPSLVGEDRQGPPHIGRVTSPSLSTAAHLSALAINRGDGWTSALAEVPVNIGGSGPPLSSVKQTASTSVSSTVPSAATGLNMAETLAQVPRVLPVPQLSLETQKLEELAIKQSRQLVPMTPSMPKASLCVLNSLEKPKPKGSRSSNFNAMSKGGQQSSAQLVSNTNRGSSGSNILKPSQVGGFQVLNRTKNGFSPSASDNTTLTNAVRALNPLGVAPSAATTPLLSSPSKVKVDGKRPLSQQNRSDFFNSLRKKFANHLTSISERSCSQSSTSERSDVQIIVASASVDTQAIGTSASDSSLDCSMENGNCTTRALGACEDFESSPSNGEKDSCLDPTEEVRLLRLFGWKENAGEEDEALTAEEIDAFIEEYQRLRPSSKFSHRRLRLVKPMLPEADGGSGLSSSGYMAEDRS